MGGAGWAFVLGVFALTACRSSGGDGDAEVDVAVDELESADQPVELPCSVDEDCDDGDPCTTDSCDLVDGMCDSVPVDADGDGFSAAQVDGEDCGGTDCDDGDDTIWPGASPVCDGADHDCSGAPDDDEDEDGYLSEDPCGGDDCDDHRAAAHPGATPDCANEFDGDCDGIMDCAMEECGGIPCPCTASEWLCDGLGDEDCDGLDDCADPDCMDPCACSGSCGSGRTCCSNGCCDTDDDAACCGECGTECETGQMCCHGECAECCDHVDCDDANICTSDSCESGLCIHDFSSTDMNPCPAGICCSGSCIVGGDCCSDTDCGCKGTAAPCSSISDGTICAVQTGCSWDDRSCIDPTGIACTDLWGWGCEMLCTNCVTYVPGLDCGVEDYMGIDWCELETPCSAIVDHGQCLDCNCTWVGSSCVGPADCDSILDDEASRCETCPACYSQPGAGECSGLHPACNTYGASDCNAQAGCGWMPTCVSGNCSG